MSDARKLDLERAAKAGDVQAEAALAAVTRREGKDPRDLAILRLVEQDVARWGESERDASFRGHSRLTLGAALNELANRAELAGAPDDEVRALRREADAAITRKDVARWAANARADESAPRPRRGR
jgi:hypothetical protein